MSFTLNIFDPQQNWRKQVVAAINSLAAYIQPTLTLTPAAAPSAPASGWSLYCDSGDLNKLKAIASTGTIVTLGTP